MSYRLFILKVFLFAVSLLLFDSALTFVLAHHCGPTQPLPEFPRHSCRTHTQTWQPGEAVDIHPGGAQGRGAAPTQGTGSSQSLHCQLINNKCVCGSPGYTGRNIPCRPEFTQQPQTQQPDPCVDYRGPSAINDTSRPRSSGGLPYAANQTSPPAAGSERWEDKKKRQITDQIENEANELERQTPGFRFDRTRTQVDIKIEPTSGRSPWRLTRYITPNQQTHYAQLANRILDSLSDQGELIPPQRRLYSFTLVLGGQAPASPPAGGSQPGGVPSVDQSSGRPLRGGVKQTDCVTGTDYPAYPPPQTVQPPQQPQQQLPTVTYGRLLRLPPVRNAQKWLPIDIEVPYNLQPNPNSDREGPLSPGPAGQYYTRFRGRLLQRWSSGSPGQFRITALYTVNGTWENMSYTIELFDTPFPPYQQ